MKVLAWACALAAMFPAVGANAGDRYVYVVRCDARVDKLDTVSNRRVESVDLATRTRPGRQLIPKVEDGLDGCLANMAIYDRSRSRFYTIAPTQARSKADGSKDYRALAFSIPGLILLEKEKPVSAADPSTLRLMHGTLVSAAAASPRISLELGDIGHKANIENQILETSGDVALLRLFTGQDELVLAIANQRTKALTQLNALVSTTALNVHLAPGGSAVLVEEAIVSDGKASKTGRLILYDSAQGNSLGTFDRPETKDLSFIAITPNGRAVYGAGETYSMIDLGRAFSDAAVTKPFPTEFPAYFFANR